MLDDNTVHPMYFPAPPAAVFMWDPAAKVLQSKEPDEEVDEPPSPRKSAIERKRRKKKKRAS